MIDRLFKAILSFVLFCGCSFILVMLLGLWFKLVYIGYKIGFNVL